MIVVNDPCEGDHSIIARWGSLTEWWIEYNQPHG